MEKYGFVYIWRDKKHKRYYIGSHWGTPDDGYICSSNWMRDAHRRRPEDFKRRILSKIYTNRLDLLKKEQYYLEMIKSNEVKIRYYNISLVTYDNAWYANTDSRIKVAAKISKSKLGQPGTKHTEESKQKIRMARSLQIQPLGWKLSEETKQKMRKPKAPRTDIHRANLSNALKGHPSWNKGKKGLQVAPNKGTRQSGSMADWEITKDDGTVINTTNLVLWCEQNGYKTNTLKGAYYGNRMPYQDISQIRKK